MRIRSIKPDFWTNEKLSALPAETHLLAAALLNYADDEGYFNANPKLIQGALFPIRELSLSIPVMLTSLSTQGGIGYLEVRISGDGRAYGWILNFSVHQVVNRPRPSTIKPLFDACCIPDASNPGAITDDSVTPHGRNGMEGNGKGIGKGKGNERRGRGDDLVPNAQPEPIRQRMLQVNQLARRRDITRWSVKEFEAFKAAGLDHCSDDDFAEQIAPLQAYYAAPLAELRPHWKTTGDQDFRRRDLITVLENWSGEVDRATKFCEFAQKKADEAKAGRL